MKINQLILYGLLLFIQLACKEKNANDLISRPDTPNLTQDSLINDNTLPIKIEFPDSSNVTDANFGIPEKENEKNFHFGYDLNHPDEILILSRKLKEISGLTYDSTTDELLSINDEQGIIYHLSPHSGEITSTEDFGKKGDYEGIEKVADDIYVLKNNGHIYLRDKNAKNGSVVIRTELRDANDAEGLGYDRKTHCLLIACKGRPEISSNQKFKKSKVIYALNIKDRLCSKEPFLKISDQALTEFVQSKSQDDPSLSRNLKSFLQRANSFAPSGIAQHPAKDHFYILSSLGKLLIVVNRQSEILGIEFLENSLHPQPEGICFNANNELYISNEGKFGIAKIFKYHNKYEKNTESE